MAIRNIAGNSPLFDILRVAEGLSVLVLESNAPGGQAGSSSRIENYLGFPMGISGQELADRAFVQAEKFGAQISIARTAAGLKCAKPPYTVELDDAPWAARAPPLAGQAALALAGGAGCASAPSP